MRSLLSEARLTKNKILQIPDDPFLFASQTLNPFSSHSLTSMISHTKPDKT